MVPMRLSFDRRRWLGGPLCAGCLALVVMVAPASAELSSVDAYGGQAQVLGKPVHHHAASNGAKRAPGSSGAHGQQGAGTSASGSGGEPAQSSSGSGSGSNAAAGSGARVSSGTGASTTPSGTAGAGGQNAVGSTRAGHRRSGHSGAAAGHPAAVGAGATSGSANGQSSPPIAATNLADVSDGSLSLSALDVLLLLVLCAGLTGIGVLIRRWSQQAQ